MKETANKNKSITIRVTDETRWKMKEIASSYGMSMSDFIVFAALSMGKSGQHMDRSDMSVILQQMKAAEQKLLLEIKNVNDTLVYIAEKRERQ